MATYTDVVSKTAYTTLLWTNDLMVRNPRLTERFYFRHAQAVPYISEEWV